MPLSKSDGDISDGKNFYRDGNFYIYGLFDDTIATEILPPLLKQMDEQSKLRDGRIRFYIDSNGGYTRYLWNLITLIQRAKDLGLVVETHTYGFAASCASMLACAGTKGARVVGENSIHLCHLGGGGMSVNDDTELERQAGMIKSHFNRVRKHYKKYAKVKDLERAISHDSYYIEGKDIIKNGLADYLIKEGGNKK